MFAHSIESARRSGIFTKIVVASDDEDILNMAHYYGADEVFQRDSSDSGSRNLDIDWLMNLWEKNMIETEYFSILRPTSPQRSPELIVGCFEKLLSSCCDSIRTVSLVSEHPGKMWRMDADNIIVPYLTQEINSHATHAMQYQSLETLYIQTSVLEIAKTRVIPETKSREGNSVLGFITHGFDTLAIDTQVDMDFLQYLLDAGKLVLPSINRLPYGKVE